MSDKTIIVDQLPADRWQEIADEYRKHTNCLMPGIDFTLSPQSGNFFIAAQTASSEAQGGEILGFAHLEIIYHLNSLQVRDQYRHRGVSQAILNHINAHVPMGASLIVLPDNPVLEKIFQKYGLRELPKSRIWRLDR